MALAPFDYHEAGSFDEAFALRGQYGDEARYFSGGTALMLLMRAELLQPAALINVRHLEGMRGVSVDKRYLRIGAATPHAEIAASPEVRKLLPTVAATFDHVATPRVRNMGTVGGNLAHANPHQDPPVTLTAFGAQVVARGPRGERRIALDKLFVDFFQTSLAPDEIITAVEIPLPQPGLHSTFVKYLPRSAEDYATVNVAVTLRKRGDRVAEPRIVVGSMGPTVLRALEAEKLLEDRPPEEALLREVGRLALKDADPELDSRGTPEYKKRVAPVIVERAIWAAWQAQPL